MATAQEAVLPNQACGLIPSAAARVTFAVPMVRGMPVTRDTTRRGNMSQLLERLASVLGALDSASPEEQDAAEVAMTPFLKRVAYRRIPFGSQQQTLLLAEFDRDRATVAEFLRYTEHPAIRQ